ncbi:DUF1194 domain-containing protein [Ancylobacter terrae]|uniref:DUF1194 domain-containing protein n=1 Tax=Ancylobacter sp. sgz301288 TaxID=3342077 RepID=UPI00385D940D
MSAGACGFVRLRDGLVATLLLVGLGGAQAADGTGPVRVTGPVPVDVELVIAADVSTSMDRVEKTLQRDGFVAAFRDPEFIRAVARGRLRRIAVTYAEWGGTGRTRVVVPWTVIDGAASAEAFADSLAATFPGRLPGGTAVGEAIAFGTRLFEENEVAGARRVIDISGDGIGNRGTPVEIARRAALVRGITINGLPIVYPRPLDAALGGEENWPPEELVAYYEREVIGGPDAFVEPVAAIDLFADAIRRKLIREVAGAAPIGTLAATP